MLDPCPEPVEYSGKEPSTFRRVGFARDDRGDAACARRGAIGAAVVALVGDRDPRGDVGTKIEGSLELGRVARLAPGQMEIERIAIEVGLEMDFGREAATRAAERLVLLPPLAPAAETWARTTVLSKNWIR